MIRIFDKTKHLAAVVLVITLLVMDNAQAENNTKNFMNDKTINLVHPRSASTESASHAIIWLHGLGATADDFPPIVPELGLNTQRAIRFVFPQAPNRPITINGGMMMPGWYDIKGVDIADKQDNVGMSESQATVDQILSDLINEGIPSENIILAGFSQGGAVVYHTGLRSKHKLGGILAMSTYLAFADAVDAERSAHNQEMPIFASHGTVDPVVPIQLGKMSASKLEELGYTVKWKDYPMEHQVSMEQIKDIGEWINKVFD